MKASEIVTIARRQLSDTDASLYRWDDPALLGYVQRAVQTLAGVYPEAVSAIQEIALVAGAEQSVDGVFLGAVSCNGRAVTNVDAGAMDDILPSWRNAWASNWVLDCAYSQDTPGVFWVYPPQPDPATATFKARVAAPPSTVEDSTELGVQDVYAPVLADLVTADAFAENTDAASKQAASRYRNTAMQQIKAISQGRARVPPREKEDAT